MQELVVDITPIWIRLMRKIAKAVLVYIEVVEAATAKQVEEACEQDD